ncbi:hypothetical protein ASG56_17390 [Rhodococcus sp. Leaf7]|jgi:hypothetical protein|uniref:histone-like nucleoid-structuring protein Lsr2 n=1 Tax=unclassified Rhodococcus (in: high G+C Gram-positive bacteria) TaxID=192944 RepID=UPI0006F2A81C|nr:MULTISPECIES: Lsr2 family protein [unclassified Rhodococcus (in: high G+C Gram-positive bacteria)]KQU02678.1 hypothetical protein ASG56_17390 [Rhodococcus sp. Leaf7]KQU38150.1 hypothetical protein ASG64_20120 [Rhodococcus sp. Leaf247]
MAKKVVVHLVDDIDSTPIDEDGEHITFAVDGQTYEIDLGPVNAAEFRRTVGYYVDHAAKVSGSSSTRSGGSTRSNSSTRRQSTAVGRRSAEETKAVREWALGAGYDLAARGRIPSEVQKAYDASH